MTSSNHTHTPGHPPASHIIYLVVMAVVFIAFTVVFLCFPRTTFSELEKRELAEFPDISKYQAADLAKMTADISQWFSDSEPFRDGFMTMSMQIRGALGFNPGNSEAISFKAADPTASMDEGANPVEFVEENLTPAGNPMANENAKVATAGTIVTGSGKNVRALMAFGAGPGGGAPFVKLAKEYTEAFPDKNVYAMVIPSSSEFYLPTKGASLSKSQKAVIDGIQKDLPSSVKFVDSYSYLAAHTNEDIYLRTDHHWAPRGAFYAAKAFAKAAGVSFKELDSYDEHVIHRYVGSMYGYTKDIAVKNAPEDFVYYTPKNLDYKAIFTTYETNKDYQVVSSSKPIEAPFFRKFEDGSGNAYLTFMGGDQKSVKVVTGTNSPRKMLLIKDSFGNALPGYLFFSFGEVHVIDFRYFPRNIKDYVKENGITDILLAFNVFNTCSSGGMGKVSKFLTNTGKMAAPSQSSSQEKKAEPAKDNAKKEAPKKEAPKKEAPKKDTPKKEAPKKETPKADTPKPTPKAESPAPAAPKPAAEPATE